MPRSDSAAFGIGLDDAILPVLSADPAGAPSTALEARESYPESCLRDRAASGSTARAMTLPMTAISPECLT